MELKKITPILVVILAGLVAYNIFFGRSAVKEAKRLTKELEQSVDSLRDVANSYEEMQYEYVELYNELSQTKVKLSDLKMQLKKINSLQTNDVGVIQQRLRSVVMDFDSLDLKFNRSATSNTDLDSLRF